MVNGINIVVRAACLGLGAAAAGLGCYASYEAMAGQGYLQLAGPIVALAAAMIPAFLEYAWHHKQFVKALALLIVAVPCVAVVFLTAVERVHSAKAGGEAVIVAEHDAAKRAEQDLAEAKAAAAIATKNADKVRGRTGRKAEAILASETAAIARVDVAKKALVAAQGAAITDSEIKQPDWLLPLALDLTGMVLISVGFGLGRTERKAIKVAPHVAAEVVVAPPAPVVVTKKAVKKVDPKRSAAARKGWEKRRADAAAKRAAEVALQAAEQTNVVAFAAR